jgi:hypothetical protein
VNLAWFCVGHDRVHDLREEPDGNIDPCSLHHGFYRTFLALAIYLISETATQDPKVGGPIRAAEIPVDGKYSEISTQTIKAMSGRNEEQNKRLREFFFGSQERAS